MTSRKGPPETYESVRAEEDAMIDASELIAGALDDAGLTRSQLADLLGVSRSEVTARLRGERNISLRKLAQTLFVLGQKLTLTVEPKVQRPAPSYSGWEHLITRRTAVGAPLRAQAKPSQPSHGRPTNQDLKRFKRAA